MSFLTSLETHEGESMPVHLL